MKPPYRKSSVPATVIHRRRSGSPIAAQAMTAASHATAKCGHPLDRGRSPNKDCRACCQRKLTVEKENARRLRELKAQKGRLPDGSRFDCAWDAAGAQWNGVLHTTIDGKPRVFAGVGGNAFGLLKWLDRQYRRALRGNQHLLPVCDGDHPIAASAAGSSL